MRLFAFIVLAGLSLAGCGGSGDDIQAGGPGAALAAAPMGLADPALCEQGGRSDVALAGGRCVERSAMLRAAAAAGSPGNAPDPARQAALPRAGAVSTTRGVPTLLAPALFDWAQATFPGYFHGPAVDLVPFVRDWGMFTARYYPETGNYVGVLNAWVYVYGPTTRGRILAVDSLDSFTCRVYACRRTFTVWDRNELSPVVKDASGDDFAFYTDTRCLYSYARDAEVSSLCLDGPASTTWEGQPIYLDRVVAPGGGCMVALADRFGWRIDLSFDPEGKLLLATRPERWDYTGCS